MVKSKLFSLLLLLTLPWSVSAVNNVPQNKATNGQTRRPKIAVVLAGGGAKGVAHVPVLKAIEDAGIPIDLVVGTSIGSIVGGMYCVGYSPDSMRQIIGSTDWIKMITDNPDFGNRTLQGRKDNENYLLRVSYDPLRRHSLTGKGGVIHGTNVMKFFKRLTHTIPDSIDFADLPVPFACVGTNAVNGECKVFTSGNLPTAMRASMAIPTVFTPVAIDSLVYIDGGVVDNFPVDVARQMGADIVIGVDLKVSTDNKKLTNSAIDLLMNCVDLFSRERYKQNVEDADIYIPIDVTGYSAASFGAEALDTLMTRGDYYASLKKAELDSLGRSLHLPEPPNCIRIGEYCYATTYDKETSWEELYDETRESLRKANNGSLTSSINIGGRFDNIEYASISMKANMVLAQKNASLLRISARLGERMDFGAEATMKTVKTQRIGLGYKFEHRKPALYHRGKKGFDATSYHNYVDLHCTQESNSMRYKFGIQYNNYQYFDVLSGEDQYYRPYTGESNASFGDSYFVYYLTGEINSFDRLYFPSRGQNMELGVHLISDNLYQYQHHTILPIFNFNYLKAFSFNTRFTLIPHLYVRVKLTEDVDEPLSELNMLGGLFKGMNFRQQVPFAGTSYLECITENGMGIVGLTAQQRLFKSHYIVLRGDVCTHTNHLQNVFNKASRDWGVDISYNIRTVAGPLSLTAYWNTISSSFDMTFNAGYYF